MTLNGELITKREIASEKELLLYEYDCYENFYGRLCGLTYEEAMNMINKIFDYSKLDITNMNQINEIRTITRILTQFDYSKFSPLKIYYRKIYYRNP